MKINTAQYYGYEILQAFKRRSGRKLRRINDHIIKDAAIAPSKTNVEMAVISYILSKIMSKPRFLKRHCSMCLKEIERSLQQLVKYKKNEQKVLEIIEEIKLEIANLDKQDPRFLNDLITKGKLKMAATFYAKGMSAGRAAKLLEIDKQEVLEYAGQTMMFERMGEGKAIEKRIKELREFLFE